MLWLAIRITVDLSDMEYLRKITVATSGGILLFYMLGAFLGISYDNVIARAGNVSLLSLQHYYSYV